MRISGRRWRRGTWPARTDWRGMPRRCGGGGERGGGGRGGRGGKSRGSGGGGGAQDPTGEGGGKNWGGGGSGKNDRATAYGETHSGAAPTRRYAHAAVAPADYHRRRPTARQLDEVFWLEEERVVSEDW